jgi:hypothetical protein
MRKLVGLVFLLLFVMGNCALMLAQSSRGALAVTAYVQTSATWIRGWDGKWTLIIANAPDPASTFLRLAGKHSDVRTVQAKVVPGSKQVRRAEKSRLQGGRP